MPLPKIDEVNAKKPLCYDPRRDVFIYYGDIVSGREKIIQVDSLSAEELKKLVIKRQNAGPEYTLQSISGPPLSRDDVVRAILSDDPFGRISVEAEKSYLRDILAQIAENL
jgi:hypothetical protein